MYNLTAEQETQVFYKVLKDIVIRDLKTYIADYADPKAGETWPDISLYLHWNFGHCRRG